MNSYPNQITFIIFQRVDIIPGYVDDLLNIIANDPDRILKAQPTADVVVTNPLERFVSEVPTASKAPYHLRKYFTDESLDFSTLWLALADLVGDGTNLWDRRDILDKTLTDMIRDGENANKQAWSALGKLLIILNKIFMSPKYFGDMREQIKFLVHFGPFALWLALTNLQIIRILPIVLLYIHRGLAFLK